MLGRQLSAYIDAGGQAEVLGCESSRCGITSFVLASGLPVGSVTRRQADERALVWNEESNGAIKACKAPPCAGGSDVIVTARPSLGTFTMDDAFVYFVDLGGIWRVARSRDVSLTVRTL
ncbi:MAG: hypothetical protein NVS3B10_20990 [Polyangiales bacterium]